MKRSKQVFLTLLIPAVAAFGCAPQAPAVRALQSVAENGNVLDCDQPAKPGEPEKVPCSTNHAAGTVSHSSGFHVGSSGMQNPVSSVSRGGFGGTGAHLSGGS